MSKRKKGNSVQIRISRTQGEWNVIFQKITPPNKSPLIYLSKFIRKEVLRQKNKLIAIPESVTWQGGDLIEKRPYIDTSIHDDIIWIATKMKTKPSVVIDRLIMDTLIKLGNE